MMRKRFAGVETGGQSIRVAIAETMTVGETGSTSDVLAHPAWRIVEKATFATEGGGPADVLVKINAWLREHQPFECLGVASFGPIDPCGSSPMFGYITTTPKTSWRNVNLLKLLTVGFETVPVRFDTDVNAAALNEVTHGGHIPPPLRSLTSCAYITVGTGVGVGIVVDGHPVHGLLHPEMGHMFTPRAVGDTYPGCCPFHKEVPCVEAMVASHALAERFQVDQANLQNVPDTHPDWDHVAHYLAHMCATLVLTVSPCVIVLGGGIMNRELLLPAIRRKVTHLLSGYIDSPAVTTNAINNYIVKSRFGGNAGIHGALELARLASVGQL
ncbi:ROK family protein [Pelomyxa schiedti]|nr:ROK family protein [Pelomyxa schiedti]